MAESQAPGEKKKWREKSKKQNGHLQDAAGMAMKSKKQGLPAQKQQQQQHAASKVLGKRLTDAADEGGEAGQGAPKKARHANYPATAAAGTQQQQQQQQQEQAAAPHRAEARQHGAAGSPGAAPAAARKEQQKQQLLKQKQPQRSAHGAAPAPRPTSVAADASASTAAAPAHAFTVTDARDHAETPFEAYAHLEPLLYRLAQRLGKTKDSLRIYDPYFCAGSCVRHLARLGFSNVYNRNEDFYQAAAHGTVPEFDVLVTNPPFSGDHMRRALEFASTSGRPWALLMPDFIAKKAYYAQVLGLPAASGAGAKAGAPAAVATTTAERGRKNDAGGHPDGGTAEASATHATSASQRVSAAAALSSPLCGPLRYLGPADKPYTFSVPRWLAEGPAAAAASNAPSSSRAAQPTPTASRPSSSSAHTFTPAAFQCVWFLALGPTHADAILSWWGKKQRSGNGGCGQGGPAAVAVGPCVVSGDVQGLPQLALDPNRKRREEAAKRPWRKKLLRQRKQLAKQNAL